MPSAKLPFQEALDPLIAGLQGKEALSLPSAQAAAFSGQQIRQMNSYQALLSWYGVETELEGENFVGHCPFRDCPENFGDKDPKFSMNIQTAQFQCFRCGIKGNNYTFIREMHYLWFNRTTEADLVSLCKLRHNTIDLPILKEMQLAYNRTTSEWMLPVWATEGKDKGITNLYVWRTQFDATTGESRRQILSGPSFKHTPYGIHRLRSGTNRKLWLLEGQWDYLAFNSLLNRIGQSAQNDTLGAPGAGTFPRNQLGVLNGREIIMLYDNDEAGIRGMEGLMSQMAKNAILPASVHCVVWPSDLPKGFDVTDSIRRLPPKYCKKGK